MNIIEVSAALSVFLPSVALIIRSKSKPLVQATRVTKHSSFKTFPNQATITKQVN